MYGIVICIIIVRVFVAAYKYANKSEGGTTNNRSFLASDWQEQDEINRQMLEQNRQMQQFMDQQNRFMEEQNRIVEEQNRLFAEEHERIMQQQMNNFNNFGMF